MPRNEYKTHYEQKAGVPICNAKYGFLTSKEKEKVTCCKCKDILKQIENEKLSKPHKRIPF